MNHYPINHYRASGRSTREIDMAIQDLFHTGECIIIDHHGTNAASDHTFRRLLLRLRVEHEHILNMLIIDHNKFRIRIKGFEYEQ